MEWNARRNRGLRAVATAPQDTDKTAQLAQRRLRHDVDLRECMPGPVLDLPTVCASTAHGVTGGCSPNAVVAMTR